MTALRRRRAHGREDAVPTVGVAPLAIAPPRAGRRRRYVSAAVVTGTLATLPLSSLTTSRASLPEDLAATDVLLAPEDRPAPPVSRRHQDTPTKHTDPPAERGQREGVSDARSSEAAPAASPMAEVAGVPIVVPSEATALIGFHESMNPGALAMAPSRPIQKDHGAAPGTPPERSPKTTARAAEHEDAPSIVLPTRNRAGAPTSAVDIAIPEGELVLAPVSGEVVAVNPYFLYGEHPDVRIDVVPEGRPDLRVVIIHVSGVHVEVGDTLVAGETPLADTATAFPFESQIDRFVAERHGEPAPHVHIEVSHVA